MTLQLAPRQQQWYFAAFLVVLAILFTTRPVSAEGVATEGFTAPYRVLEIGAPESGVIEQLFVKEGDVVRKGDQLARLDCNVHEALLAIARQSMEAEGVLIASQAEWEMRKRRLDTLTGLHAKGHAPQDELDRAAADEEIAEGNLLSAQEQLLLKRLDYAKIQAQIERRIARAPIDGVITTLHKQQGELAAPNSPELLIMVQLDPLLADFAVPRGVAETLASGDPVRLFFPDGQRQAVATVEFVSPLIDAESGTVAIKVRIDNSEGLYHSGEPCVLKHSAS